MDALLLPHFTNIISLQGQSLTHTVPIKVLQYPHYRKDELKQSFYQGTETVLGKTPSDKGRADREGQFQLVMAEVKLHHRGVGGTVDFFGFLLFKRSSGVAETAPVSCRCEETFRSILRSHCDQIIHFFTTFKS